MILLRAALLALALPILAQAGEPLATVAKPQEYDQLTVKLTPEQFKAIEKRAEAGDAFAIDAVFFCRLYGLGTTCHTKLASDGLKRGIQKRTPLAILFRAKCCSGFWLLIGERRNDELAKQLADEVLPFWKPLAEKGSVFAQVMVAHALRMKGDATAAAEIYRKAADAGDALAQVSFGDMVYRGEGVPKNEDESLKWFTKAGEQGFANAWYNVAIYHTYGAKKNPTEAFKAASKSAEMSYGPSTEMMVTAYRHGKGVEANPLESLRWLVNGLSQGYRWSRYLDGYDKNDPEYKRSPQEIVDWIIARAEAGGTVLENMSAGVLLGYGIGVKKDIPRAIPFWTKAANQGDHESLHDIFDGYVQMADFKRDGDELFTWGKRAAANGCTHGKRQLGACYDNGWGTGIDSNKALELYQAGYDPSDKKLIERIAYLKAALTPAAPGQPVARPAETQGIQPAKTGKDRVAELETQAQAGNFESMFLLSRSLLGGTDGVTDVKKGIEWELKAADGGHKIAVRRAAERYDKGDGVEADRMKAMQYYKEAAKGGEPYQLLLLGRFLERNEKLTPTAGTEMFEAYKAAADKGDKASILQVARCYNWGRGVAADGLESVKWYEKVWDMDFRPRFEVGMMLVDGRGVAVDVKKGFKMVEEAAQTEKAGDPQYQMGVFYHTGVGVTKDDAKAIEWLKKSKTSGNQRADAMIEEITKAPKTPPPNANSDF